MGIYSDLFRLLNIIVYASNNDLMSKLARGLLESEVMNNDEHT